MKRFYTAALCVLLAAAVATPALAKDHSISGFLMTKAIMVNHGLDKDAKPDKFIDQRFRARWAMVLNEYVSVVYYGEVDIQYGDSSYNVQDGTRGRNGGGALGGDQNNIETKNIYMDVKVPDTPVSFRLGLQGYATPDFVLYLMDAAGLTVNYKADMFDAQFGYGKLLEGDNANGRVENEGAMGGENDADLYFVKGSAKPVEGASVGLGVYWIRNRWSSGTKVGPDVNFAFFSGLRQMDFDAYYPILDGSYKLDPVTITGWVMAGFGSVEDGSGSGDDMDLSGFAATLKVSGKAAGVTWGVRGIYWSADDPDSDDEYEGLYNPLHDGPVHEHAPFALEGFMLMLGDKNTTTVGSPGDLDGLAIDDASGRGHGLMAATATVSFVPPAMPKAYVFGGVGYFAALEDEATMLSGEREGKAIGTEVAVRAGYKLADVVDLSVNAAYAWLGDFYDGKAVNEPGEDPDDPYMVYLMAKVGF